MNKIIGAFALALCISAAASSYSDAVQTDLRDNLVRLHIIANSDSDEDQSVKLKVRDAILDAQRNQSDSNAENANTEPNLNEAEKIANAVLRENGFDYTARAEYGKFSFPEKTYKSMTLPAGDYYGVRIILGSGSGHNWWCVMYPPLCFREGEETVLSSESEKILREKLDADTYDIITKKDNEIIVKFKVVEIVQEIKQKINGD
jgi:stage II sporulation protein R